MIYSRYAEYAVCALVYLATLPDGEYALVKNIVAQGAIPEHFLAKILQSLARDGLLQSTKGPHARCRVCRLLGEISMRHIVESMSATGRYDRCIGGSTECSDQAPCGMHDA